MIAAVALVVATPSWATIITFDDLPIGTPVTDQYESLGVVIDGGIIAAPFGGGTPDPVVSTPNVLNDFLGPGLRLTFTGALPTTVSMYVTTFFEDRAFLDAFGPDGILVDADMTEGWGGTEENSTPAVPREFAEVSSAGGIALVTVGALFARRGDLYVDDLGFVTGTAVPEPPATALFAVALLLGLGVRWGNGRRRPFRSPAAPA
jgi:hypothetical protein